jgi:DNA-binding MarR family transcriptional regulator
MNARPPIDFGPLDGLVGYQLRRAFLRSNQLFGALAGKAGLQPGQYGVLKLIGLNPGRSQSDIAAAAGLDRSSLTQLLDQLCKRGLVERRPGPDRRTLSLHLTGEGEATLSEASASVAQHERAIRGELSDEDARTLVELLKRLRG